MSLPAPARPLSDRLRDGVATAPPRAAHVDPARPHFAPDPPAGQASSLERLNAAVAELRAQAVRPFVFHALAAFEAEDLDLAVETLLKALDMDDRCGPAWHLLGVCRERAGDFTSALKAYETALTITPDEPELANDVGRLAAAMGMKAEAEALFLKYLEMKPGTADGLNNLACAQRDQLRFGDAVETLKGALAAHPESPVLWNTIGTVMAEVGDLTNALTFFDEALRLDPGFTKARYNRGNARLEGGDAPGALADCDQSLAEVRVSSERSMMTLARATILLALGRLAEGWEVYRIRNDQAYVDVAHFLCEAPEWTPDLDVHGKSVLVFGEQGLGDEVLFANALPDLAAEIGASGALHLAIEPRLIPLFRRSFPQANVVAHATWKIDHHIVRNAPGVPTGEGGPDCWAPIGDLLRRYRPSVESFPRTPAFLTPDPQAVAHWRAELARLGPGLNVGVVWKSMRVTSGRHRFYSPFEAWEPVLRTPGVNFVSLQYGDASADIALAREAFGATIHPMPGLDVKDDLDGLAALTCALDLCIGPANASTNLAGACGAPTWIVSTPSAWPRLGQASRYPWYPAARVFAPAVADDWASAMAQVAAALDEAARAPARAERPEQRREAGVFPASPDVPPGREDDPMALDTDIDDQDQAETFDEEATGGDGDQETSYPYDRDRGVLDETARRGDADLEGDDEALDADEESDEALDDMDDAGDEDDLDDDDSDDGPLATDAIPDFTADRDFAPEDGEDEVSATPQDDAETVSMGDMTNYAGAARVSDLESDNLSDSDLKELDYMADDKEDRVLTQGGEAVDGDKAADDAATDDAPQSPKAEKRHEDKRLDEGLEETFPASDPVSAKHIT